MTYKEHELENARARSIYPKLSKAQKAFIAHARSKRTSAIKKYPMCYSWDSSGCVINASTLNALIKKGIYAPKDGSEFFFELTELGKTIEL